MMDYDSQLKVQARLDGELAAQEVPELEARLAEDSEAQALLAELEMTRGALAGFEAGVKLPESPELFWSKIQREIRREIQREIQRGPKPAGASRWASVFAGWQRWLAPVGAVAGVMAAVLVIGRSERAPEVETSLADSGAFTYHDFAARTTLVWLSYPADNELVDSEEPDTLD